MERRGKEKRGDAGEERGERKDGGKTRDIKYSEGYKREKEDRDNESPLINHNHNTIGLILNGDWCCKALDG